jgi:hypothetical protein
MNTNSFENLFHVLARFGDEMIGVGESIKMMVVFLPTLDGIPMCQTKSVFFCKNEFHT